MIKHWARGLRHGSAVGSAGRRRNNGVLKRSRDRRLRIEPLESRVVLNGDPLVISELMASNDTTLADQDGDFSDWIEVYNPGTSDVQLGGFYLTDDATDLTKWSLPDATLGAGNFLLVFASGKDRDIAGEELHTNFKLTSDGEYLALTEDDSQNAGEIDVVSEFAPTYPQQYADVSYGIGQSVTITSLLDNGGAEAKLFFPRNSSLESTWFGPAYNDSGWTPGTQAIGYEQSVPGFTVTNYQATITVDSLADTDNVIANPSLQSQVDTAIMPVVNLVNTNGAGHFFNDFSFPGTSIGQDVDDFVTHATGTITIPTSGMWTFGVNSDDGHRVRVDGANVIVDDTLHAPADRFGSKALSAGTHTIDLVFFERGGGAEVELFAAPGSYSSFNTNFKLVGDTASGGLAVATDPGSTGATSNFSEIITTDVETAMYELTPSAYLRVPVTLPDQAAIDDLDSLSLRVQYDDGFVAYLNGVEVARRNAPATVHFDSTATVDRDESQAVLVENIDVSQYIGLLQPAPATNVLAIQGLNDAVDSDEFLLAIDLAEIEVTDSVARYITEPTPGEFNPSGGFVDFVSPVDLSQPHGFYAASFQLTLSTTTPGAAIRYTLDGRDPTASDPLYTSPITIDQTTAIRARGFKTDYVTSNTSTATYLFLDDIIHQPESAPPGWPTGSVNGQALNYGMDPDIVNDPVWGPQMEEALLSIPSMAIVIDPDDLFDSSTGIYVNASGEGRQWERPTSLEMINPDGSEGFQIDAGIRIRGGFSRTGNNPKHAFRMFFRKEYGAAKLEFPLFGDEGTDQFDNIDLRTSQNYSWAFQNDSRNTMNRDVFSRDAQRDMGQPYTRSNYYHLYINGNYFGLFQTQERSEASYAESYFEGNKEDFDVVKAEAGPYNVAVTDGNSNAWRDFWEGANQIAAEPDPATRYDLYQKLQGNNPDGTRNPDFPVLLDAENLVDYMLVIVYGGNRDAPISNFLGNTRINNWFGIRNRNGDEGWKFFAHDNEHTLLVGDLNLDRTGPFPAGDQFQYSNPQWIWQQLWSVDEFRTLVADHVQRHFYNGGVMSPEGAAELFSARAAEIDMAIIAESARWGDARKSASEAPFTKNTWESRVNTILNNYMPTRSQIVVGQLRGDGLYPSIDAPQFNQHGGDVPLGFEVAMTAPAGTIYYTTDGSDPRLVGGGISPSALPFVSGTSSTTLIPTGARWSYLDNGANQGTAWRATSFNDSQWSSGNAQLGYGDGDEQTVVSYGPNQANKFITTYFRHAFTVSDTDRVTGLRVRLQRDDGAVVYLNGQELLRSNIAQTGAIGYLTTAGSITGGAAESTFYDFSVDPSLLVDGTNVLAVEIHQVSVSSSDISFDLELIADSLNPDSDVIELTESTQIRTRAKEGSTWSALSEATFLVDTVPATAENLVISEINYNPHAANPVPGMGEEDADNDEFEYAELLNTSATQAIDLSGVEFTDGISFDFNTSPLPTIEPGQRILIVKNQSAFESRYGTGRTIAGQFTGGLANGGEQLELVDATGATIATFAYNDSGSWPGRADGGGSSLELVDPSAVPTSQTERTAYLEDGNRWRNSAALGGSPGTDGTAPTASLLINEFLSHSDGVAPDWIELYNPTAAPIDASGWYLSEDGTTAAAYFGQYQIPAGTTIAAGHYLVLNETETGIALDGKFGDEIWLIAADASGRPTWFVDHVEFDATATDVSLGRWPSGTSMPLFPMTSQTAGATNSGPVVGEAVISELHYHPTPPPPGSVIGQAELEFVEVTNNNGSPLDLSDWQVDGFGFQFADATTLAADGTLVVVRFDPATELAKAAEFREIYAIDATVPLLGPATGQLQDNGEKVKLLRPENPGGVTGYLVVDQVKYANVSPWPAAADGTGDALARTAASNFGSLAASWSAATPTPGATPWATTTLVGDMNLDGRVDSDDVGPFVLGLNDAAAYQATYGVPPSLHGDTDSDGDLDFDDINGLVGIITSTSAQATPLAAATASVSLDPAAGVRAVAAAEPLVERTEPRVTTTRHAARRSHTLRRKPLARDEQTWQTMADEDWLDTARAERAGQTVKALRHRARA